MQRAEVYLCLGNKAGSKESSWVFHHYEAHPLDPLKSLEINQIQEAEDIYNHFLISLRKN